MNIRSFSIAGAITMTLAIVALSAVTAASAKEDSPGTARFVAGLRGAGYVVDIDPTPVVHTTLNGTGIVLYIDKGDKGAKLEIIDYNGNRDALKTDWVAVDGAGPRPRVATNDFAGSVLYWNDDTVLAVGSGPSNFREPSQAAGEIFLGRRGTGGPVTAPAAGTKLPATGTGSAGVEVDLGDLLLPVALLGAGGVLLAGCLGGVVGRRRG